MQVIIVACIVITITVLYLCDYYCIFLQATKLYTRQQWLETRLEKLVFSKRRARPGAGARLQRGAMTQVNTMNMIICACTIRKYQHTCTCV